jgi:hypothetical protein
VSSILAQTRLIVASSAANITESQVRKCTTLGCSYRLSMRSRL